MPKSVSSKSAYSRSLSFQTTVSLTSSQNRIYLNREMNIGYSAFRKSDDKVPTRRSNCRHHFCCCYL
ncbi:unnamed protein product [Caretta caretta]